MYKFPCDKCGKNSYSSNDCREQEQVECANCGALVPNPYEEAKDAIQISRD